MKNYPTNREHVSFSELKTWGECSWRHHLRYVLGLKEVGDTVYTDYGTLTHNTSEAYLRTRVMNVDDAEAEFRKLWVKRGYPNGPDWPSYADTDLESWVKNLRGTLEAIPAFLDETFPEWEFVDAEADLSEPIPDQQLKFKGYVDAIIRVKKRGKWIYWILDWKTAPKRGWDRKKRSDKYTTMQVVLYKYFWAIKNDIPIKDVRCGYVLLRRDVSKKRIQFFDVSAGPKTIEKAHKMLRNMIRMVSSGRALKNRYACTFCEFKGTEHCKINL